MKALQATCIVGAITFTGMIHLVGGNTPGATVPDAMPEAAVSAETPGAAALSAAVPEASAAGSGPSLMAQPKSATIFSRQNGWPWATMMPPNRCRQRMMRPTMLPSRHR